MNADQLGEVRRHFDAASELSGVQRAAYLEAKCPDTGVRSAVERLLALHDSDTPFMDKPAAESVTLAEMEAGDDPLLGKQFGRYQIIDILGAGGMGMVYRARQEQPRRTVALKVIRTPFATAELFKRFRHEAEALGRLKHPAIAQIFEAGTAPDPAGRETPFFAMELVNGRPLLEAAAGLPVRAKLELFAQVCDGVQHAHQRGVIHRDLKPGNVLVETVEESSTSAADATRKTISTPGLSPKILDFGIARLADRDAATTVLTNSGQIVGTLAYMSPEQVRGDGHGVDERSDVYALGVILYEMLTGQLPYAVRGKAIGEAARIICDNDPTLPATHARSLRGDPETIVLKALEKDPARRYQSAGDLAADVRRHLTDMPIVARPATTTYQLRKFARRHKALVVGVAAVIVALAAGVVGTTIGLLQAKDAQKLAEDREIVAKQEARKATKSVEFLVNMLTGADPDKTAGRDVTVKELLDQSAAGVDEDLKDEPQIHLTVEDAIARTYRAIGDADKAEAHARRVLELTGQVRGPQSLEAAKAEHLLARICQDRHEWPESVTHATRALEILQGLEKPDELELARVLIVLCSAYVSLEKVTEGERYARQSYELATRIGSDEDIAVAAGQLSEILQRIGGPTASAEGLAMARQFYEVTDKLHGQNHTATLQAKQDLGWYLKAEQKSAEAAPLLEQVADSYATLYGPKHRKTAHALTLVSSVRQDLGDYKGAEKAVVDAITALRENAPGSTELGGALWRLGIVRSRMKDYPGAEAALRESVELREKLNDPNLSGTLSNLAGVIQKQGKPRESLPLQRRAVELRRQQGVVRSDFGTLLNNLANCLEECGEFEEAEQTFKESIEFDKKVRPGNPLNGLNLRPYASFLIARGRHAEAEPLAREAAELTKAQPPVVRITVLTALKMSLEGQHKDAEAADIAAQIETLKAPTPAAK